MAVTYAETKHLVFGDTRCSVGVLSLTSVSSGAVAIPGLRRIYGGNVTPTSSAATAPSYTAVYNSASGSTATNGWLQLVNGASGDDFECVLFGD